MCLEAVEANLAAAEVDELHIADLEQSKHSLSQGLAVDEG